MIKQPIVIESGIPVPADDSPRSPLYPFSAMEVSQSFRVEAEQLSSVRALAVRNGRKLGRRFVVRAHLDAWRCWRTK